MRIHKDAKEKIQEWKESPFEFHRFNEFVSITQRDYELLEFFATKEHSTKASKIWFEGLGGFEKAKNYRYGDIYRLVRDLINECNFQRRHQRRINRERNEVIDTGIRGVIEEDILKAFKFEKNNALPVFRNIYKALLSRYETSVLVDRMKNEYAEKDRSVNQMDLKLAFQIIKEEETNES